MESRTALLGTMVFATAAMVVSPRAALSPGPVTRGHAEIAGDCLGCHTPLRGTPAAKCLGCHPLDSIGIQRRSPVLADARPALAGMHRSFEAVDCVECHTDHAGSDPARATRTFSHDALSRDVRQRCVGCHERGQPADALHRQAGHDCGACHTTTEWKPASFDHLQLATRQACSACHEQARPTDVLHRKAGPDCAACHTTRAWSPASLRHDDYFVLDRHHQTRCIACHPQPDSYQGYTCYGCHEHTLTGMTAKHEKEGIPNFRDCVRCHRSASKHEAGTGRDRRNRREEGHEGGREEGHEGGRED